MLKTSRPLETTYYIQQKTEDAFLKVPADSYLDLLGIEPNAPQYAILNAINDPAYRYVVACVSRRVGKTYISNIILQLVALIPGTNCLIVAPDYNLASISWELQQDLIDMFDLETTKNNAKERIITLSNGSSIRVASLSRIDSAVGRSYDLIIFDEAAVGQDGEQAFNIRLRPTLDKLNSKCIFISTPRGDNWFKKFYDRGFSDEYPRWVSIHADYHENPRASEEDVNEAREEMSRNEFAQEYLAEFVTFEGQVYDLSDQCIINLQDKIDEVLQAPDRFELVAGLDVGFRDYTAMCIGLFERLDHKTNVYILDEYFAHQKSTEAHAKAIKEYVDKFHLELIFIDSAAAQTRYDLAAMYDISTFNAKKSILDGIGCVAALIDNDRLIVHEDCINTVYSLRNYKWKENTELEKPERTDAAHMADAIRYMIYTYIQGMGGVTG